MNKTKALTFIHKVSKRKCPQYPDSSVAVFDIFTPEVCWHIRTIVEMAIFSLLPRFHWGEGQNKHQTQTGTRSMHSDSGCLWPIALVCVRQTFIVYATMLGDLISSVYLYKPHYWWGCPCRPRAILHLILAILLICVSTLIGEITLPCWRSVETRVDSDWSDHSPLLACVNKAGRSRWKCLLYLVIRFPELVLCSVPCMVVSLMTKDQIFILYP